jgi:hypothetical protein
MQSLLAVILLLHVAPWAAGQDYPPHNFTFGAGAGRPRGDLGPVLEDSPGVSVGYGYRFIRYFQADLGLDVLFGAARVRDFLITQIGDFRIRDREYLLMLGGRGIVPLARGRVLLSGGAGGAYLRYAERVSQPSNYFRVDCPICTSRSGWGYYGQTNVSYFLDRYRHFRLGVTSRFLRGHTDGEPIGSVPGFRTKDKWVNLLAEFGFSF